MLKFARKLVSGKEARQALIAGAMKVADMVKLTYGAKGRNVVLNRLYQPLRLTKDGVSVADEIYLDDDIENIGAQMFKSAAQIVGKEIGDGTTTASILAAYLLEAGNTLIEQGVHPKDLLKGMEDESNKVINEYLPTVTLPCKDIQDVYNVANISSNGDTELSLLIKEAYEKIGMSGDISMIASDTDKSYVEVVTGYQIDQGARSQYFLANTDSFPLEFHNANIFLTADKLQDLEQVDQILAIPDPLVIVAAAYSNEAMVKLVTPVVKQHRQIVAIKAPLSGDNQQDMIFDLGTITGTKVGSLTELGSSKLVQVYPNRTIFTESSGSNEDRLNRIDLIEDQIKEAYNEIHKSLYQLRMNKLKGGIAAIKLASPSDIAFKERRDRLDDALKACKAAIKGGVVPGGGVALKDYQPDDKPSSEGGKLLRQALSHPINVLLSSADEDYLFTHILPDEGKGMDVNTGKVVDVVEHGILDPAIGIAKALEAAVSISGAILSTEGIITEIRTDEDKVFKGD